MKIYTRVNHQLFTTCVSYDICMLFGNIAPFSGYQYAMSWYKRALKEILAFSRPCEWLLAAKDGAAISNPFVARAEVS